MRSLGRRLRNRRIQLELTLQQIADQVGVVPMYVSDIERGKRIPLKRSILVGLADAYRLPFNELEELALLSRDSVELESGDDQTKRETAVALARAWSDLSPEQLRELRKIAERGE